MAYLLLKIEYSIAVIFTINIFFRDNNYASFIPCDYAVANYFIVGQILSLW